MCATWLWAYSQIKSTIRYRGSAASGERQSQQEMIEQVYQYLKRTGMIQPGDAVAAAVSGGADSVALLELLVHLLERRRQTLLA